MNNPLKRTCRSFFFKSRSHIDPQAPSDAEEKSRVFITIRTLPKCVTVEEKDEASSVDNKDEGGQSEALAFAGRKKTRQVCMAGVIYPRIPDLFGAVIQRRDEDSEVEELERDE